MMIWRYSDDAPRLIIPAACSCIRHQMECPDGVCPDCVDCTLQEIEIQKQARLQYLRRIGKLTKRDRIERIRQRRRQMVNDILGSTLGYAVVIAAGAVIVILLTAAVVSH